MQKTMWKRAAKSGAVISIIGLILVPLPGPGIVLMMTGVGLLLVALLLRRLGRKHGRDQDVA